MPKKTTFFAQNGGGFNDVSTLIERKKPMCPGSKTL